MKGVILAGGHGSRLLPSTRAVSKQLLPVYDKPMIYYPLTTLILAGITDILLICKQEHLDLFQRTLGDGSQFDVNIEYEIQINPLGIAHGLVVAKPFLSNQKCCLILGDNILHGPGLGRKLRENRDVNGAKIFAYEVSNPEEYGVVEFDRFGKAISIEEKPAVPKSSYAIPGLYFLDEHCVNIAESLTPSSRGELEITDVLKEYMKFDTLSVEALPLGTAWLDTGTTESLHDASSFVRTLQLRQGIVIGDPNSAKAFL